MAAIFGKTQAWGWVDGEDAWGSDVNANFATIDRLLNNPVKGIVSDPTTIVSPANNDLYIVGDSATGDFVSEDGRLAYWSDAAYGGDDSWKFFTAPVGLSVNITDGSSRTYDEVSGVKYWTQSNSITVDTWAGFKYAMQSDAFTTVDIGTEVFASADDLFTIPTVKRVTGLPINIEGNTLTLNTNSVDFFCEVNIGTGLGVAGVLTGDSTLIRFRRLTALTSSSFVGSGSAQYERISGVVTGTTQTYWDSTGGQVDSVVGGSNTTIDNTDPANPIINVSAGGQVDSVVGGTNVTVDVTDPVNPIINATTGGQVDSVVGGTNVTIDNTDPINPIINATDTDTTISESTGVKTGGLLSTGAGASEYSISDGTGQLVDSLGVITSVSWSGKANITPTNIATDLISWVAINSSGNVVEQVTAFTREQSRTLIILGVVVHVNLTTVDAVNNAQHIAYNAITSTYDLAESIGFFNVAGNVFSANGANLNIDQSSGKLFKMGSNYDVAPTDNPHVRSLSSLTALSFQYRFSDGSNGVTGIAIDPTTLDDGAGGTTTVPNNQFSVQRIYVFTSGNVKLQRGVESSSTLDAAIAHISSEPYVTEPSIAANGLLRGWLVLREDATDLTDSSKVAFISAPKFGEGGGSAGAGGSASDLQGTYNNSVTPEILTDATRGALTLKRGSALDTDNVLEIQNGTGTNTWEVSGNGDVIAHQIDVRHTAQSTDDHSIEIDSNANGFGDVKALGIDYITGAIALGDDEAVALVNIDQSLATGGDIVGLEVLTTEGGAKTTALLAGAEVNVIEQLSGVFADMDSALVNAVDELADLTNGGVNTSIFVANNDTVTIGNTAMFEEIEVLLSTFASKNINPTFEFSTGVGTWSSFTPVDGTNGMLNTGIIAWIDSDIPTWAVGTGSEYLIRITRTRAGVATTPIASKVQISETTEHFWDKEGNIDVKSVLVRSEVSTENVFEGKDSSGITTSSVTGEGEATFNRIVQNVTDDLSTGIQSESLRIEGVSEFDGALTANQSITVDTSAGTPLKLKSTGSVFLRFEGDGNIGLSGKQYDGTSRFFLNSGTGSANTLSLDLYSLDGTVSQDIFKATYDGYCEVFSDLKASRIVQGSVTDDTSTGVQADSIKSDGDVKADTFTLDGLNTAPTSATDTGTTGEIRWDADYMYVCTATNTWKRSAIATW